MRNLDHFFFAAAALIATPIVAALISACTTTDAEAQEHEISRAKDEIIIITPRPGVECYLRRGTSSYNTQVMSCVVLPAGVQ